MLVKIDDLIPGMVLAEDIILPNGATLLNTSAILSEHTIEQIRKYNIKEIQIAEGIGDEGIGDEEETHDEELIENIRGVLYENSDHRRKFLDKVGHRIYDGWLREKKQEWIRCSFLGGAREVGRSCLFLQTPESRVLLDCGVNVASWDNAYPFLEVPEFNIKQLDAVIITHSHVGGVELHSIYIGVHQLAKKYLNLPVVIIVYISNGKASHHESVFVNNALYVLKLL